MTDRTRDLRDCATAYDCRDQLPELAAWMNDDALKQLTIWRGPRFRPGELYFDLDNPERGPFEATGDEQPPKDWTYVAQSEIPPEVWPCSSPGASPSTRPRATPSPPRCNTRSRAGE